MVLAWLTALAAPPAIQFPNAPSCPSVAVEVAMVGDVMQHRRQLNASTRADGTHSWAGVFDPIAPIITHSDLAIANLETPVASEKPLTGFPMFNAPEVLLDALAEAGFDVLQTANNHTLDRGRDGVIATLKAARSRGFGTAGSYLSAEERATPWHIAELPGPTRVAFLAYTYGMNGLRMPRGEPWMVNWLDRGFMEQDVARAREHADIVIVGLHWGVEYSHQPTDWQRQMARRLVESGADIVMGTHPHVLQPAEVMTVEEPTGARDALVLYSLGNFVSNQRSYPKDGGVIARATIARCQDTGEHHVVDARFTPVWVDDQLVDGTVAYRVVPIPTSPTCIDDLSDADCTKMTRFRDHAATLLPASRFSTLAGGNRWTLHTGIPPLPWIARSRRPPVAEPVDAWPPVRLARTQATAP